MDEGILKIKRVFIGKSKVLQMSLIKARRIVKRKKILVKRQSRRI